MQNPSTENHQPEVFLSSPGVGDGQGGLVCCDSWGRKESDTTEQLNWLTDWWADCCLCWTWLFACILCSGHEGQCSLPSLLALTTLTSCHEFCSPGPSKCVHSCLIEPLTVLITCTSFSCLLPLLSLPSLLFFSIVCFSLFGLWFSSTT